MKGAGPGGWEPRPAAPSAAVPDFAGAATSAFSDLRARTGLRRWWVARRRGDEGVVLASLDGDPEVGATAPWATDGPPGSAPLLVVVPLPSRTGAATSVLCGASPSGGAVEEEHLDAAAVVAGLLGALLDREIQLDDEVRRAERAEAAAHTDALTGLGNRRAWDAALAAEEARASRHGSPAAVVVLDLDGLKRLNDTEGHDAGDDALRRAGHVLQAQVRGQDTVARLGGDEFAVLMPDTERDVAAVVVERLRAALAAAGVAVSGGFGARHGDGDLVRAWREADEAMYADKRAGRGTPAPALTPVPTRTPGPAPAPTAVVRPAASGTPGAATGVAELLGLVRTVLGAEVAFVSAFEGRSRRFRHVAADREVPFAPGTVELREGTYCDLIVAGELPRVIPDTSDSAARHLPVTTELAVGSHVGVPLLRSDGSAYGTLCAFSRHVDLSLRPRDADALSRIATSVMALLEVEDAVEAQQRAVLDRLDRLDDLGGLRVVHHPVVRLADAALVGHTAAVRFPRGTPSSAEWFAGAAAAGLGEELELRVLDSVLAGLPALPGQLLVNASADTASTPRFARALAGADPSRLVLQVVGEPSPSSLSVLRAALAPLRRDGLRLAISGAGTRDGGAEHLVALEPDLVALHPRVVSGVAASLHQQALVNGLLAYARTTGARLLARGVDRPEDLHWLRGAGAGLAQGQAVGTGTTA